MEIFMDILLMLGGVGVFLHGMTQMSRGIEQSAGAGVKRLFKKISKNRFMDYCVGIGVTTIVQSSSATSIMTIGLANAGIVDVKQGSGIILGAKVGTTLTAFIFAFSGMSKGKFSIGVLFSAAAFVGVIIMMTTQKESLKKFALFLMGFGLLFLGMEVMDIAIGGKDSPLCIQLAKLFDYPVMQNPVLLLVLGILFTCIIQSSTAATAFFITFLSTGVISSVDQAFFLAMGANIGTCLDGIMASFGSNINGKRIALFHVMTSTMGAVAFSIVLVIFRSPITNLFVKLIPTNALSLAIYNLSYNIIYTLIMLACLKPVVKLVTKIVKDKPEEKSKLSHVDERLLATPAIAIGQTLKEVYDMAKLAQKNLNTAFDGLINEDTSKSKTIADGEYEIDHITSYLASYMIKISALSISYSDEKLIGGLHHVISDLERIGDHAVTFAKETNYMKQNNLHFIEKTKAEFTEIYKKLTEIFDLGLETFKSRKTDRLRKISELHQEILNMTSSAKEIHTARLTAGEYPVEVSKSLYSVLLSLQRIADHLINVTFSIRSNTGSKSEVFKNFEKANENF